MWVGECECRWYRPDDEEVQVKPGVRFADQLIIGSVVMHLIALLGYVLARPKGVSPRCVG